MGDYNAFGGEYVVDNNTMAKKRANKKAISELSNIDKSLDAHERGYKLDKPRYIVTVIRVKSNDKI